MKNAIVTFVIGERYERLHDIFRPSVERYCKRYDIDYIVLKEPLDRDISNHHKIGIQKLLIASQDWSQKYDKVMWLDSDIYISDGAENVFDQVKTDKIYMVQEYFYNDKFYHDTIYRKRYNTKTSVEDLIRGHKETAKELKCYDETDRDAQYFLNQGVMVFQPKYHSEYLKKLYDEEVSKKVQHPVVDQNGNKNPYGEYWFQYKFQAQNMLDYLDHKYNSLWTFYRSLHCVPYDEPGELLLPMKSFIDNSYFCHFTDMEDVGVLCKLKELYLETPETTLVVNYKPGTDISWMLSKYIRAKDFKTIHIDETAQSVLMSQYPRQQTGFVFPKYKYTFTRDGASGRCIICDSDWLKTTNFDYMLHLFKHDENSNSSIKVVYL